MRGCAVLFANILISLSTAAFAQSPPIEKAKTSSGKEIQLGYYAIIVERTCSAGPVPAISVPSIPGHGVLIVRTAVLKKQLNNCSIETPARVVFYRSSPGFSGSDTVSFVVTNPLTRKTQTHSFIIEVTSAL